MKRLLVTGFLFLAMALLAFAPKAMAIGTLAGEIIENQAYADFQDANGNPLDRVFSNIVQTVVSQVYAVRTEPETAAHTGIAGTDVSYPATIHNDGNGDDTFDLTISGTGWTTVIYLDADQDGVLDQSEIDAGPITDTGVLAADETLYVIVVTTIPGGTANLTEDTATLTATSQTDPTNPDATDFSEFTTTVAAAVVNIIKAASTATPLPGEVITYSINVQNNGTADAINTSFIDQIPANTTYVTESMRQGSLASTYTTATVLTDASGDDGAFYNSATTPVQLEFVAGTLTAGQGFIGYFQVTVNADVPSGTVIENIATASFELPGAPGISYDSTSNEAGSIVATDPAVTVTPDTTFASGDPSDTITYPMLVCNEGNDTDTLDITYTSTAGWTWTFWYDANEDNIAGNDGDYLLTDTDADGIIDTNDLAQGACAPILAVAVIPAGTSDGSIDSLVVTATSTNDPTVSDTSGNLVTTVTAPVLSVIKTVSPEGAQPPDTTLTYTVTVTNIGTGVATNVVITDVRPEFTTYVTGSIKTGSPGALVVRTDAVDGDGAQFDAGSNTVVTSNPSLGSGGIYVLEFQVTIN